eukprot:gene19305-19703_t
MNGVAPPTRWLLDSIRTPADLRHAMYAKAGLDSDGIFRTALAALGRPATAPAELLRVRRPCDTGEARKIKNLSLWTRRPRDAGRKDLVFLCLDDRLVAARDLSCGEAFLMAYTIIDNRALRAEAAIEPEAPVAGEDIRRKSANYQIIGRPGDRWGPLFENLALNVATAPPVRPKPLTQDGLLGLFSPEQTGGDYQLRPASQAD